MGLLYDNSVLLSAIRLSGSQSDLVASQAFSTPQLFFGPSQSFSLNSDTEYTLAFDLTAAKLVSNFNSRMDVYITGSAFPNSPALGYQLESYNLDSGLLYNAFDRQLLNFTAQATGTIRVRFVVFCGQWHVANSSLQPASEFGFTPDEVELLVPVVGHINEYLNFTIELYDINNNLVSI